MPRSLAFDPLDSLKHCIALAQEISTHAEAKQAFEQLKAQLVEQNPQAAALVEMLWNEAIAARRSSAFWEQLSSMERGLAERLVEDHANLKQNYMRLVQEQ